MTMKRKSFFLIVITFLFLAYSFGILTSCSVKPSIVGTWRLESGKFSCSYSTFDHCAIELSENGEYIVYSGEYYTMVSSRGAYSNDEKHLEMIADDVLHLTYNYSKNGDDLSIVSSAGTARFKKIDMDKSPVAFDESVAFESVIDQGYEIVESKVSSYNDTKRMVEMTAITSYTYLDLMVERRDEYEYSAIAERWFLSESEVINTTSKWNILGRWKGHTSNTGDEILNILSIDDGEVTISYDYPPTWGYSAGFTYNGTLPFYEASDGRAFFKIPSFGNYTGPFASIWTTIFIDKFRGLYSEVVNYNRLE